MMNKQTEAEADIKKYSIKGDERATTEEIGRHALKFKAQMELWGP